MHRSQSHWRKRHHHTGRIVYQHFKRRTRQIHLHNHQCPSNGLCRSWTRLPQVHDGQKTNVYALTLSAVSLQHLSRCSNDLRSSPCSLHDHVYLYGDSRIGFYQSDMGLSFRNYTSQLIATAQHSTLDFTGTINPRSSSDHRSHAKKQSLSGIYFLWSLWFCWIFTRKDKTKGIRWVYVRSNR